MNEKLRKMLEAINAKKQEVKNLVAENKIEEAKTAKAELVELQNKFDLIYDLEEEEEKRSAEAADRGEERKTTNIATAFVNAIKAGLSKEPVKAEDMEILNSMSVGSDKDGGLTVPKDISTSIKELRRSSDALETIINVETVATMTGSRVIEKDADHTPFDNVDEEAEFPDEATPEFEKINYTIKKKGGILKVTRELLQDTAENIMGYLRKWISKKAKATRNALIVKKINEITAGKEVPVTGINSLKDIFNVKLDPAIAVGSMVLTNQSGFNWLDKLKDDDGKYILQPDPTKATSGILFGKYPIMTVSNKTLKSKEILDEDEEVTGHKHPIICGDFKEAITLFDRENLSIEISTEAGDLWSKDQTGIKVRERLDIQAVDETAIIKAEHTETVGE